MFLRLLGFIDLATAFMILLTEFGFEPNRFYFLIMLLHASKALLFINDALSLIDLSIVLYTLILPFWGAPILSTIIIIFLLYKGAYSFA